MWLLHSALLAIFIGISNPSVSVDLKREDNDPRIKIPMRHFLPKNNIERAQSKDKLLTFSLKNRDESPTFKESLRRSDLHTKHGLNQHSESTDTDEETSHTEEIKAWKADWNQQWNLKKVDAILDPVVHEPRGDIVNMNAARPWSKPCGDPNMHDLPWGSCTLPSECEPDLRIYRGDVICGRTSFVCCAVQNTDQDMYQAFDLSFADNSALSTSSDEKDKRNKGSRELKRRKRRRVKNRLRKKRRKRKREIKRHLMKLMRFMRQQLNRAFHNGTLERKKVTMRLKKLIKKLKQKYRKERKMVKKMDDMAFNKFSQVVANRVKKVRYLNEHFIKNQTFKEMVLNSTGPIKGLAEIISYPELDEYPELQRALLSHKVRRSGGGLVGIRKYTTPKDYLEYDVEFGTINL